MAGFRAVILFSLAALFLLLSGVPMFQHPTTAYTGVRLHRTGALFQRPVVDVDRDSPAYRAGIRSGDILSCLSTRDRALLFDPSVMHVSPAYVPGTPISVCVESAQSARHLTFTAQTRPPARSIYGSDLVAALRLSEYGIFLLAGIILVMGRPGAMTWIFFAYCVASLPNLAIDTNMTTLAPTLYAVYSNFGIFVGSSAVGFLMLFATLVPEDYAPRGWRQFAFAAACIGGAAYVALGAFARVQTTWLPSMALLRDMDFALTLGTVVIVLARLATMHRSERARFGWAAFAIIWGVVTNNLRNVAVLPGYYGTIPAMLTVIMPLTMMYAILIRHVIDVRFVISRTVVYAAVLTLVVGLIGVVDWATSAYLHEVRVAMALEAIVTIGLGFVLHRTYRWLEYAVDFFLFRRKHEAEAYLRRLAKTLHFAEREEAVDKALVHDPYEKFELTAAALFRVLGSSYAAVRCEGWNEVDVPPFDRDHDVVRFLLAERTRLSIADLRSYVSAPFRDRGGTPAVAVPVFQGNRLTAFALYGIHRSGTRLDPDEIETLEHLCETAAQAYTGIELARFQNLAAAPMSMEPGLA